MTTARTLTAAFAAAGIMVGTLGGSASALPLPIPTPPNPIDTAVNTVTVSPKVQFWKTYCTVNLELQNEIEAMGKKKSPTLNMYKKNVGGSVSHMAGSIDRAKTGYQSIRFVTRDNIIQNHDMVVLVEQTASKLRSTHHKIVTLPGDVNRASAIISGQIAPKLTSTIRNYNTKSARIAQTIGTGTVIEQAHIARIPACAELIEKNKKAEDQAAKKNNNNKKPDANEDKKLPRPAIMKTGPELECKDGIPVVSDVCRAIMPKKAE